MKTFPKPLTAEEEKQYLKRLQNGDKKARQVLIEYNPRLVAHIAKKYQMMEADMEELVSIGAVGLIKAVDTFDQEKPVSWQPMQPVVWKMRSLCISGSERKYPENPPIMSLSVQIRKEMRSDCWILWRARIRKRWM